MNLRQTVRMSPRFLSFMGVEMNLKTIDWIIVADRSRARIFQSPADPIGHFPVHATFEHEAGRLHRQDMESDVPGRISLPGKNRTSAEPHEAPEHREARKFASELCDYLDRACGENYFDRLMIVAPPMFLGILREHLTPRLRTHLAGEFHKELAQLSDSQIQSRLQEVLSESNV